MVRLLAFVATVVFVDTVFYSAITPLLPRYAEALDLSKSQAGVLAASYAAGTFAGALPAGWLAARAGVRPTVLTGLALMSVTSVVFAFGESVLVLDVARFLQGVGGAASWAGAMAWLIAAAPAQRRGELIGSALAAAIAGALFGPVLGGLADALGPEGVFSSVGLVGAVLIAWALRMPSHEPEGARLQPLKAGLRDPVVYASMWLVALPAVVFGTIGVLGPLRLAELGAGTATIALVFLLAAGLEALVNPLAGRAADRRGRVEPMLFGVLAAAIPVALIPWPQSVLGVGLLILLAAPAIGLLWAPAHAMLSDAAEHHGVAQGLAFALMNLAWASGQTAGAAGSAQLAERLGDPAPFMLLTLLCAGSAVLLVRSRRRVAPAAA